MISTNKNRAETACILKETKKVLKLKKKETTSRCICVREHADTIFYVRARQNRVVNMLSIGEYFHTQINSTQTFGLFTFLNYLLNS